ncbi:hypothetical protein [Bradyrhizobium sp. NAS80.1]|uniref:hypothetical protein n=1 Tax=Bradyrhizobium sp. NAS80.1 TaxID=1680159 RepID=UPI00143CF0D7|nr:hypothetical protein [Bradyrhizobium sp. NAS80.1]
MRRDKRRPRPLRSGLLCARDAVHVTGLSEFTPPDQQIAVGEMLANQEQKIF